MKREFNKRLSYSSILFAVIIIVFFILSILHAENLLIRIILQTSQSLLTGLIVIHAFTVRKQKLLGYFLIGLFVLSLYGLINTIYIAVS